MLGGDVLKNIKNYLSIKINNNMKKAIGYIRVSTEDQSNSMQAQRSLIESYALLNKYELIDVIIDEGVSGKIEFDDRIGGKKALDMLSSGKCVHIISTTLDRMFRNAADCILTTTSWDKHGIEFSFVNMGGQSLNSSTPMGKAMIAILGTIAELERNMIAERVKTVLNHKKNNLHVYSREVYGYKNIDGVMIPDQEEMKAVNIIKSLHSKGKSLRYIAEVLNNEGYPTKGGAPWIHTSVNGILKNKIYDTNLIK